MSKYLKILNQVLVENEISMRKVIDIAQTKMQRQDVYVLYSYGKDSGVVLNWAAKQKIPNFKGAIAIDTTISIPNWSNLVKEECDRNGYDLKILRRPDGKTFDDCSINYGFGGPTMHSVIMRYLKLEPLRAFERQERENKPLFLSGVRMFESKRRFGTVQPITSDHGWFVAPFYNWQDAQVMKYFEENKIARSPAYETLHTSGDCLCGCFAQEGEFELIKIFHPDVAKRIEILQEKVREAGKRFYLWGDVGLPMRNKRRPKQAQAPQFASAADAMVCGECGINRPQGYCKAMVRKWQKMSMPQREKYFARLFA